MLLLPLLLLALLPPPSSPFSSPPPAAFLASSPLRSAVPAEIEELAASEQGWTAGGAGTAFAKRFPPRKGPTPTVS